ncbi:MAG: GNAT family N-acetyltransferase [Candidatus Nanopelagicales bacterium]
MVTLRLATSEDYQDLIPLIKEFCEVDNHEFDDARIEKSLGPLLEDAELGRVIILEVKGELKGYAVLTWGWSLESGGREALLDEIYVRKRNQGWGALLLEKVVATAKDNGAKIIFLETELANERVRDFYIRHSFNKEDSIWLSQKLTQ